MTTHRMRNEMTSLFLFGSAHRCECGRHLDGSYVELPDEPRGAARSEMLRRRGSAWSHEVNGPAMKAIGDLIGDDMYEDIVEIRRTHMRIPANPPGEGGDCFCGGLGEPYSEARRRGARTE
jgi:hypothetical protein